MIDRTDGRGGGRRTARRYCLISPCRDEAAHARQTLESVTRQSVEPALWIIVDDGSSDETPAVLADYAARFDWIRVVRREAGAGRNVGPGVVDAFYHGLASTSLDGFDYVGKLDLDVELPARYFERLIERMEADPRLGTCSGKPYFRHPRSGKLVSEGCGDEMSVGMTKLYRVSCFREIGGLVREVMWDGIDCHRARMLGWSARSWDEDDLRFIHLRPMGSSQNGWLAGRARHGYGQYFMGTGLLYMTASALLRMCRPPLLLGGLAMWWGYVRSLLARKPRYDDPEFRAFLRRYQRDCLLFGKSRATRRLEARGSELRNAPPIAAPSS